MVAAMLTALLLIVGMAPGAPASAQPASGSRPAASDDTPERRPGEGEQSDARKVHYGKAPPGGAEPAGSKPPASSSAAGACASADDCELTMVGPDPKECCPTLCTPRAVTRRRAGELKHRVATCSTGRKCPHPLCAPPLVRLGSACRKHRCLTQPLPAVDE